jgi:hypothetical protein
MVALKQFIVKGIAALSLICVATLAEAIPVNVRNPNDADSCNCVSSLRAAINGVNAPRSALVDEIRFNAGFQINLSKHFANVYSSDRRNC